jgi:hypothetical protein
MYRLEIICTLLCRKRGKPIDQQPLEQDHGTAVQ